MRAQKHSCKRQLLSNERINQIYSSKDILILLSIFQNHLLRVIYKIDEDPRKNIIIY